MGNNTSMNLDNSTRVIQAIYNNIDINDKICIVVEYLITENLVVYLHCDAY